ncbi:MAG: N-acetylmuramoyl-L-alanine amidase family protein [Syntrophales bacterium]
MNIRTMKKLLILLMLIIFPLTDAMAQPARGKHLVTIDPAHGGADTGVKISDKEYEKDITLAVSLLIKKELDKSGNVLAELTRTSDRDVSLSERKQIIKKMQSEIFVSIHVNAGFSKNSTGFEIYFPGFKGASAEQSDSKEILKDMARNKYLNDSVKLAQLIQKNMDKVFPRKSRGLRDSHVPALEGLSIPAVVVEIGFATNPEDRKKIVDASTQAAIAHALCQSIKDFF